MAIGRKDPLGLRRAMIDVPHTDQLGEFALEKEVDRF